jgi:ubiquinone/menaquinone biosynthesis C-methylase UbiE
MPSCGSVSRHLERPNAAQRAAAPGSSETLSSDTNQAHLDRLFDRVARAYDLQILLERRALLVAARFAGPLAGCRVLDLATGTGALAATLLDAPHPPAELVALDRSRAMLDRARNRLAALAHRTQVRFAVADARRRLPCPSGRFDVVTIGYLLHLLDREDALAVLREARRVLRRGGRLVTVVHSAPASPLGRLYRRGWQFLARAFPSVIAPGPVEDLRPLVEGAGFTVREGRRVGLGYWSQVLLSENA